VELARTQLPGSPNAEMVEAKLGSPGIATTAAVERPRSINKLANKNSHSE
jgi:hypothetical protein